MDLTTNLNSPAERRKQVRLQVRPDLQIFEQKYEGKTFHVVKDPVCLRYYRFNKQEYFVVQPVRRQAHDGGGAGGVRGRVQAAAAGARKTWRRSPGNW